MKFTQELLDAQKPNTKIVVVSVSLRINLCGITDNIEQFCKEKIQQIAAVKIETEKFH